MTENRKTTRIDWTAKTLGIVTALSLVAGIAGSAMASERGQYDELRTIEKTAGQGQALSMEQIVASLNEQGFEEIYEVERERGAYEVKARSAQGDMVKLYVDLRTGKVLSQKRDD